MKPGAGKAVYEQVLAVAYEYFGPAAERFIERAAEAHLGKKPYQLTTEDIPRLHDWSKLAVAMLVEDPKVVDGFSRDLMSIASDDRRNQSHS